MTTSTVETGAHHTGGLPTPTPAPAGRQVEGVVQVVIMLAVAAMAGAASFRHVHDWTMHNSPVGTGDWFGWANAMVTELIPLAAGLEARRRRRNRAPIGAYPIALILGAVALSLTGQFAEAKPGLSGWVIAAIPALGFLALVKLVLSSPTPAAGSQATPAAQLVDEHAGGTPDRATSDPAPATAQASRPEVRPEVPAHLFPSARFALVQHEQATGRPITAEELAARMSVSAPVAGQLLAELGHPAPTRVNGHPVLRGGA